MGEGLFEKAGRWVKEQIVSKDPAVNDALARADVTLDQPAAGSETKPDTSGNKEKVILGSRDGNYNVRTDIKEVLSYKGELTDDQTAKLLNGSARIVGGEYIVTSH